jgi:predicted transcriptional regulator of viral defense system
MGTMRKPPTLTEKIQRRLRTREEGDVFVTGDFLDLGTRAAVDQALSRLTRQGAIRRIRRGVYDRPRVNARLGIALSPVPEKVANAIACRGASRLQVAGAQAANALGLSTQVPARIVYLTDGTPRTVHVGKQTLVFRHASPRNMATAGRTSGTVIQALRHLGKKNVDEEVIQRLRQSLSVKEKTVLKKDRLYAPGWMQPIFDKILASTTE